jgi:hypothetical protein
MRIPTYKYTEKQYAKKIKKINKELLKDFCKFIIPHLATVCTQRVSCDLRFIDIRGEAIKLFSKKGWCLSFDASIVYHDLYSLCVIIEKQEKV